MHLARIELALVLWKSTILPLNYKCTIALPRIELRFLDIFRYISFKVQCTNRCTIELLGTSA